MRKYTKVPALSGKQLIKLYREDSWQYGRKTKHGRCLYKFIGNHKRIVYIPESSESLPTGTLMNIIGSKQSNIRKKGLLNLLNKYGL